jgi:hypothetical protein
VLPAVAAGGVALVVGLGCGGLLFGSTSSHTAPPPPATGDASPAGRPPDSSVSTGSAPPPQAIRPGGHGILPADLGFMEVAGVRLPVSDSAGPQDMAGGLGRGFARDRAGVALAAVHILVRVHPQVGADVFGPTLAGQVIGPHRQVLAANVEHSYRQLLTGQPVAYGQPTGRLDFTITGYTIDAYTPGQAGVRLLLEVPTGSGTVLGGTGLRLAWHEGDWALVAPAGGAFTATWLVTDPAGFTRWPPGSGS